MNKSFTSLIAILTSLGISGFVSIANAEPVKEYEETAEPESISGIFNRTFFDHSGDFFRSTSYEGQFNLILGFEQFPENQVIKDTENLGILMRDYQRHTVYDQPLKTRNIPNPYQSSLEENPSYYVPFSP
jgi:hypothetical protein